MSQKNLQNWLEWQQSVHPIRMDLGLERCRQVAEKLKLFPLPFPIITVAGTNGKGSSVATLDAIFSVAEHRVGRFTSPHLLSYNERISVTGQVASDEQLCEIFAQIEAARGETTLTFFEFAALAAALFFVQQKVDVAILEVGLGGRLDAVNVFYPTLALITSIDIDHVDWLGDDRETIGFEKAGILRAGQTAVCSDPNPPQSVLQHAKTLGTDLYVLNNHFYYEKTGQTWAWHSFLEHELNALPLPNLQGDFQLQNAAGALMAALLLQPELPTTINDIKQGLTQIQLPGRFQVLEGDVTRIFDVAHNPQGVATLKKTLEKFSHQGKLHAVFSALATKDVAQMVENIKALIDTWYIAELSKSLKPVPIDALKTILQQANISNFYVHASIEESYQSALEQASVGDCVIVFGSFYTVAAALKCVK